MDAESEADTQRAEAGRAEANVKREGMGNPEPADPWTSREMARATPSLRHPGLASFR